MSIALIIDSPEQTETVLIIGTAIAKVRDVNLTIVCINNSNSDSEMTEVSLSEPTDKSKVNSSIIQIRNFFYSEGDSHSLDSSDLDLQAENNTNEVNNKIKLYFLEHSDPGKEILKFLANQDVGLYVACQNKDPKISTARKLFEQSPAQVLVLHNVLHGLSGKPRILVPATRGRNTSLALGLSHTISSGSKGNLTATYIEPEGGEDADIVGKRQIEKNLKAAKLDSESVNSVVIIDDKVERGLMSLANSGDYDLVIMGASEKSGIGRLVFGNTTDFMVKNSKQTPVGVVKDSPPILKLTHHMIDNFLNKYIPQLDRDSRINLFENIQVGSHWSFDFVALIALSSLIASLGLIQNSAAVVIGAMLVAPLMTPMIGAGLGLVQGNIRLTINATKSIIFGFLAALFIGIVTGLIACSAPTQEILARGEPNTLDLLVAIFSGVAASYAVSRPNLSGALPGVAISAALVPPITSSGIAISLGDIYLAQGAAMLFGTNLIAIILSAAATLYAVGTRPDRKFSAPKIWVRRTLLGLIVAAIVVAIPLSTGLFKYVKKDESLKSSIESSLLDIPWSLKQFSRNDEDLIIEVEGQTPFTETALDQLVTNLVKKGYSGKSIKIVSTIARSRNIAASDPKKGISSTKTR